MRLPIGRRRSPRWDYQDYLNPHRAGDYNELIASLLDCVRLDREWLRQAFPQIGSAKTKTKNEFDGARRLIEHNGKSPVRDG